VGVVQHLGVWWTPPCPTLPHVQAELGFAKRGEGEVRELARRCREYVRVENPRDGSSEQVRG
jgi:hypothetical protein